MATSPIYNWPEPDNTDLVKNGALAIRTLGNAIDTTMATMTPKSLVDAKGDLVTATANDTPARLAVGANGETLVADSSTATGLKWSAPAMTLINTTTFSAVSSQTIDSLFSSTYDNYRIMINITASSAADLDLYAQFRSGGSNVTTNNNTEVISQYSSTVTGSENSNLIRLNQISTNYAKFANCSVDLFNPFLSATTTLSINGGYVTNAGVPYQFRAFAYNNSNTSMTGINIYASTGTISGTIRIYGLRN